MNYHLVKLDLSVIIYNYVLTKVNVMKLILMTLTSTSAKRYLILQLPIQFLCLFKVCLQLLYQIFLLLPDWEHVKDLFDRIIPSSKALFCLENDQILFRLVINDGIKLILSSSHIPNLKLNEYITSGKSKETGHHGAQQAVQPEDIRGHRDRRQIPGCLAGLREAYEQDLV